MHPVEILSNDLLYRRVLRIHLKPDGSFSDGIFGDAKLSVDLARLTTPEETAGRAAVANPGSNQEVVGVVAFQALSAREKDLKVYHAPLRARDPFGPNDAHSIVEGVKRQSTKTHLKRNSQWVWPVRDDGGVGPL